MISSTQDHGVLRKLLSLFNYFSLNNIGIKSTVLEKASKNDIWNSRSYTIVLNDRGQQALVEGKCLNAVKKVGKSRKFVYFINGQTGEKQTIPSRSIGIGVARPMLVKTLEKIASKLPRVTIKRGVSISKVSIDKDSGLPLVHLEDGSIINASHVVGADGLGSTVRASFPFYQSQSCIERVRGFCVIMKAKTLPKGWKEDGTYMIMHPTDQGVYFVASPRPNGDMGASMMCFDNTVEKYPWLAPNEDEHSDIPCNVESHAELSKNMKQLMREEFPGFYKIVHRSAFKHIRVNRNITWLRYKSKRGNSYSTADGRVTLIGDASVSAMLTSEISTPCTIFAYYYVSDRLYHLPFYF